jgi:hypothetical protein
MTTNLNSVHFPKSKFVKVAGRSTFWSTIAYVLNPNPSGCKLTGELIGTSLVFKIRTLCIFSERYTPWLANGPEIEMCCKFSKKSAETVIPKHSIITPVTYLDMVVNMFTEYQQE